jgi:hypothetical protein
MFGLRAFYRRCVIFAMLPDKRAFQSPRTIACKLPAGNEKREGEKWQFFELHQENDVGRALDRLAKAYRRAAPSQRSRRGAGKPE